LTLPYLIKIYKVTTSFCAFDTLPCSVTPTRSHDF